MLYWDNIILSVLADMMGLMSQDFVCEKKVFKLNSGFNMEPIKDLWY